MRSQSQSEIATAEASTGLISRTTGLVHQMFCGLHGHDPLLHFGDGRLSLVCGSCGYETPGWDLKGVPREDSAVTPCRLIVPIQLVSERRVA